VANPPTDVEAGAGNEQKYPHGCSLRFSFPVKNVASAISAPPFAMSCTPQIIAILKQGEAGLARVKLCRQHGISEQTYYRWKAKYDAKKIQ
jgi:Transposase